MVKCESLRMNIYRITHTGKSVNFPVTRERIGHFSSLYVSYQVEGRESAWMQEQLELGTRMFNITLDCPALSERFHEMLFIRLNTF